MANIAKTTTTEITFVPVQGTNKLTIKLEPSPDKIVISNRNIDVKVGSKSRHGLFNTMVMVMVSALDPILQKSMKIGFIEHNNKVAFQVNKDYKYAGKGFTIDIPNKVIDLDPSKLTLSQNDLNKIMEAIKKSQEQGYKGNSWNANPSWVQTDVLTLLLSKVK
jgi:hypothetical protein